MSEDSTLERSDGPASDDVTGTSAENQSLFARRRGVVLVTAACLVMTGALGLALSRYSEAKTVERREAAQVDGLHQELARNQAQAVSTQKKVNNEVLGLNQERKAKDDKSVESVMSEALTWSSGEEYMSARRRLVNKWGLTEDSQLLSVFLPGEEQGAWAVDGSGKRWFAYTGVNSSLDSFSTTVTRIDGTSYTYLAVLGVRTLSTDTQADSVSYSVMSYTVDGSGTVSNVTAWAGSPGLDRTY